MGRRSLVLVLAACVLAVGSAAQGRVGTHGSANVKCIQASKPTSNGSTIDLTGTWFANDGATYWIHQIGNCVWWAGFSGQPDTPTMGTSFSNVFSGIVETSRSGLPQISGYWADVPRGGARNFGTLVLSGLRPDSTGLVRSLTKLKSVGGFSATTWNRASTSAGKIGTSAVSVRCSQTVRFSINGHVIDLTGTWSSASDGGTYWIRQVGNCVWWAGFSGQPDTPTMGKAFSNVFLGAIGKSPSGVTQISGFWADVPRGTRTSFGTLTLSKPKFSSSANAYTYFRRLKSSGGFGATVWKRTS